MGENDGYSLVLIAVDNVVEISKGSFFNDNGQ